MGDYTLVEGKITITPALTWKEIRDAGYESGLPGGKWKCVKLRIRSEEVETDDGTLTRRSSSYVIPVEYERYKAYSLAGDLNSLIDAFPGHQFTGYFECSGEEIVDIYRVYAYGRTAKKVYPEIVWPEDVKAEAY